MRIRTDGPHEYRIVAEAVPAKEGLTIDGLRQLVKEADAAGIPGDTPLTEVGVTWTGRLKKFTVKAVPR